MNYIPHGIAVLLVIGALLMADSTRGGRHRSIKLQLWNRSGRRFYLRLPSLGRPLPTTNTGSWKSNSKESNPKDPRGIQT